MEYKPKPYQEIAADFLDKHNRSALFLDMGLGKTVITLTHIKKLIDNIAINKCLVIAPKRVAEDTWTRENAKWDHLQGLTISKVLGTEKQRVKALETPADIYVINRENVVWLVEHLGTDWCFDCVVIDELSSFKSPSAKRFRVLRRVLPLVNYIIGLTGTPASNGYLDLYSEIYLIDNGVALGKTLTAYRNEYFYAGAHNGFIVYEWKLKSGAKQRIDRKLSELCLSMSKEDWLTLPPIIYNNIDVKMDTSERKVYDQFQKDKVLPLLEGKLSDLDSTDSAVIGETAAVLSGKLLQMANGAVYDDNGEVFHVHDRKLEALDELVESCQGEPLLVFYSYKHDLDRIMKKFPQARLLKGEQEITDWNNGNIPILLCHPASAAFGINIQAGGHIMCWFGMPWSLELYTQSIARLYRQGQDKSVIVHHIVCEGTLDDKVLRVLQQKESTQRSLLEALKNYIKEI